MLVAYLRFGFGFGFAFDLGLVPPDPEDLLLLLLLSSAYIEVLLPIVMGKASLHLSLYLSIGYAD
jgi:hypothetical protein